MDKKLGQQGQSDHASKGTVEEAPVGNADLFRTINADEWRRIQTEFLKQQARKESKKDLSFTDLPVEELVSGVANFKTAGDRDGWSPDPALSNRLGELGDRDSDDQIPQEQQAVDVGYTLNKNFELIQFLGEGATGRVFLAEHHRWRTRYAVKVLHPWVSRQDALMRPFLQTFRELETFRHDGIVRPFMLDYDTASESVFYFMDFVDGENLVSVLSRKHNRDDSPPLTREEILQFLEAIVGTLRYAHERSFYAGNLQPSRILLPPHNNRPPQLLSLGLMPSLHSGNSPIQSGPLHAMYYAAPELKGGDSSITAASDVFSLGVMVYQLLTGALPVGIARPPSEVSAHWPKALDRVMSRAMQADPGERYHSLDAFLEEFQASFKSRSNVVQLSLSGETSSPDLSNSSPFQPVVTGSTPIPEQRSSVSAYAETPGSRQVVSPRQKVMRTASPGTSRRSPGTGTGTGFGAGTGSSISAEFPSRPPRRPPSVMLAPHTPSPIHSGSTSFGVHTPHPAPPSTPPSRIMGGVHLTNSPISTWPAHEHSVSAMSLSPDGKMLASAGEDSTLRLWATGSWTQLQSMQVRTNRILHLRWSHDSRFIAFVGEDNTVQVWDTRQMRQEHQLPHQTKVHDLAWHTNGHLLYTACANHQIFSWNLRLQRINGTLEGHDGAVSSLLFDPQSKMLVSGGEDNQIKLWSIDHKKLLQNLCSSQSSVFSMALCPASGTLATGHTDSLVHLWDFRSGKLRGSLRGHEGPVSSLAFGPDGYWLASGSMDQTIRLWNNQHARLIHTIEYHKTPVHSISLSPDGQWMASTSNENAICIWDTSAFCP